jgi:hypothetical protein
MDVYSAPGSGASLRLLSRIQGYELTVGEDGLKKKGAAIGP